MLRVFGLEKSAQAGLLNKSRATESPGDIVKVQI